MEVTFSRRVPTLEESVDDAFSAHGIDKNDARILAFTYKSPRTMATISNVLGIPVVECYGRVRKLMSLGLLRRFRLSSENSNPDTGGKVFYSADDDRVEVLIDDGKARIKLRRIGVPDRSIS